MSHFRTTLKKLVGDDDQSKWAEKFDIDRTNLNKVLRRDVPLGHLTVAKILMGTPHGRRQALVLAYLLDEIEGLTEKATQVTGKRQKSVATPDTLMKATAIGVTKIGKPVDYLAELPPAVQTQLHRILRAARDHPKLVEKLVMALALAEK